MQLVERIRMPIYTSRARPGHLGRMILRRLFDQAHRAKTAPHVAVRKPNVKLTASGTTGSSSLVAAHSVAGRCASQTCLVVRAIREEEPAFVISE
jgi:hypothetical protein